jgi:hypothetical protein
VYRAFDTLLERPVAIKLMHREIASESDQLERFRREGRAVAQLNDPHIVGVIDVGEDGGAPYIVLEYVQGETLKDRIRRAGRLPVGESVAYAIEIARALGAAHERQIVHRDVKPQNVLIDEEGAAKVTDFGIARTLTEEGLTIDGRVLGTTDYVSPEQALGRPVGPQSDLYSLGVVLFEMLTGDVPFHGENQVTVAMKHVREELPDVAIRRPDVSSALAAVVDRATAKDLADRYGDHRAMVADLEEVLAIETSRSGQSTGEATTVLRTLPERTRGRLPLRMRHPGRVLGALIALALGIAGALWIAVDRTERGGGQTRRTAPSVPDATPVNLKPGNAGDYDPEGDNRAEHPEQVKFVADGEGSTTWSTERYRGGNLKPKAGVGIYVIADPAIAARAIAIVTPTTGWSGAIYAAPPGPRPPDAITGWTKFADVDASRRTVKITLDTAGNRYAYYLVWITKLPPPDSEGDALASISEIRLYR